MVKVIWKNHAQEGAMWKTEENMKRNYPHLFDSPGKKIFVEKNVFLEGEDCNILE